MKANNRILLGMSGGLDSTMSALLLKKQGFEVIGLTLKTWHLYPEQQEKELNKASALAEELGIEHNILDVSHSFTKEVVDYFCNDYLNGRTPNPCNHCNPRIKWPWLLKQADELDCYYVATGHYVQKEQEDGWWYIKRGADPSKDQSYFLWNLDQHIIKRALFPLGKLTKKEVRAMAIENGLRETARKAESMGVCFLGGTNYRDFLKQKERNGEISIPHGSIQDESGKEIGKHNGLAYFTIGQKKGLQLEDKNYFVKSMHSESNTIIVSKTATLATERLALTNFQLPPFLESQCKYPVDIRVRGIDIVPSLPGIIELTPDSLNVSFSKEAWGITPGQSIVFYDGDRVLGGGIVK